MRDFIRPKPIDNEIVLDPSKIIMSKTDYKGVVLYANDYFMKICKYEEWELMGQPHNVIRHPDMPKVIFKFMWERLHQGKNIHAIVKNLAKDGSYYWVMTTFETSYDEDGNILAHYARRKAVPKKAKEAFENLYSKILKIEQQNETAAEKFFYGYIENSGKSYDQLFLDILEMSKEEVVSYFKNERTILIPKKEDVDLDIDFTNIEQKKQPEIKQEKSNEELEKLKADIAKLQEALAKKEEEPKKKKGLFGKFFSK